MPNLPQNSANLPISSFTVHTQSMVSFAILQYHSADAGFVAFSAWYTFPFFFLLLDLANSSSFKHHLRDAFLEHPCPNSGRVPLVVSSCGSPSPLFTLILATNCCYGLLSVPLLDSTIPGTKNCFCFVKTFIFYYNPVPGLEQMSNKNYLLKE